MIGARGADDLGDDLPRAGFGRVGPPAAERVAAWLETERQARRPFLWLAPAMMLGVLIHFARATESQPIPAVAAALASLFAALLFRRDAPVRAAAFALLAASSGFLAAVASTTRAEAPVLAEERTGTLEALVERVDPRPGGARLLLRPLALNDRGGEALPFRVRVSAKGDMPAAGDRIRAAVRLMPPPTAVRPGGYDFARDAFFDRIGAVGSVPGRIAILDPLPLPFDLRWRAALDRYRNELTARIAETIGGQKGAVAAALVTGKRGLIDEETNEALRAAGIYHVVSISGLHMAIAAGLVFWLLRTAFALAGGPALRGPAKKWAAVGAMIAAVAYAVFAGGDVATVRAMIMTLVFFSAVLADREVVSMRNLAITAVLVLAVEPEALFGPGFQMSFAAVAALVAFYERVPGIPSARGKDETDGPPPGAVQRALRSATRAVLAVLVTTVVAEAATGPFALHHFHTVQLYGLVGNALALPFVTCIVMPAALLGALAAPFGLDGPIWTVMGWGTAAMLAVAEEIARWPEATQAVPAFGAGPLLAFSVGLLVVTLFVTPLRFAGLLPIGVGLVWAALEARPDIFVDRGGTAVAVRGADGRLAAAGRGLGSFTLGQWLRADGDMRDVEDRSLRRGVECDRQRCRLQRENGKFVVLVFDPAAFAGACAPGVIVVASRYAPRDCGVRAEAVIDRGVLETGGAAAVIDGSPPMVVTDRPPGMNRLWTPQKARPLRLPE